MPIYEFIQVNFQLWSIDLELIGAGILLAIGFYVAPFVLAFVGGLFALIVGVIASIFTRR